VVFAVGLMSDYLLGAHARENWLWAALYGFIPNWQLFWMADALESEKQIPWSYVGQACTYVAGYVGASLAAALLLFEDRELT